MWVKICGIQDSALAGRLSGPAPDAIGLNFYDGSPRRVTPDAAAEVVRSLPAGIEPVGVFVNAPVERLRETCRHCGIGTVQLHGDESPEFLAELQAQEPHLHTLKAWRMGDEGLNPLAAWLDRCREHDAQPAACLIDARVEDVYGGSGRTVCWDRLAAEYRRDTWPPLILAGGLTPENVAEAIGTVHPWGVDVASGIEALPGQPDPGRIAQFIARARQAFERLAADASPGAAAE